MRRFILSAVFFCTSFSFFAVSPSAQQLVPVGHWVYDAITALAFETGETTFATTAPLSIAELRLYVREINYDLLSSAGKKTLDKVFAYFNRSYPAFGSGLISLGTDIVLTPEIRFKTNEKINWTTNFVDHQKFLVLPLILKIGDYAVIRSDLSVGLNNWTFKRNNNYINLPLEENDFDLNFPQTSYISAGAFNKDGQPFMNFQVGSGSLETGRTQTGSLILSRELLGPSYAQLSFFSTRLRYAMTPIQLNVDKYLYLHRLEARPFKRVSIALIEGVLISKPFELRYLNPAAIFHNMNTWLNYDGKFDSNSSAYFGVTFDVNPWKFLRIYGLFVMNQFQTRSELESGEQGRLIPNAMGAQGGVEAWVPYLDGYWYAGVEVVYTMPWLYIAADPKWSFFRYSRFMPRSTVDVPSWVGYPYGPDVIVGQLKLGYSIFDKWSAFLSYRLKIQGENSFASPFPTTDEQSKYGTPSGIPEYEHRILLTGTWKVLDWLSINGHTAYVFSDNNYHLLQNMQQGFEIMISVSLKLSDFLSGRIK